MDALVVYDPDDMTPEGWSAEYARMDISNAHFQEQWNIEFYLWEQQPSHEITARYEETTIRWAHWDMADDSEAEVLLDDLRYNAAREIVACQR